MEIREIEAQDRKTIYSFMRDFYSSPALLGDVADEVLLRDIDDCLSDLPFVEGFVFEDENKLIGYGMIAKSYSTEAGCLCIWVEDIYLIPEYQGQGLAWQFFAFLEDRFKNQLVRFRLEVAPDNFKAIKAYEKNGYRRLEYTQMIKEIGVK